MFGDLPKPFTCTFQDEDFLLSNYEGSHDNECPTLLTSPHHSTAPIKKETKAAVSVSKTDLVTKNNLLVVYETKLSKLLQDLVSSTRLDLLSEQSQVDEMAVNISNLPYIGHPPLDSSENTTRCSSNQLQTKCLPVKRCHDQLVTSTKSLLYSAGFTDASEVAVNSLASAADKFYKTLCQALRHNTDALMSEKTADSQNVIWRSLVQCHAGSVDEIIKYFQRKVETYKQLSERCQLLYELYQKIKTTGVIPLTQYYNLIHDVCYVEEVASEVESPPAVETNNSVENYDYDDAQQLLELAGLSGFDIQIQDDDADAEILNSTLQELSSLSHESENTESNKRKSLSKSKSPKRKR